MTQTATERIAPASPSTPMLGRFGEALSRYALVIPGALIFLVALIGPFAILIGYSFVVEVEGERTVGLGNYAEFFEKDQYPRVLGGSILIAAAVATATVLMAYPAAYFIAFHVQRNRFLWLILITLPFWTSYLLRVFAWKLILGWNGVINSGLIWLGVIGEPLEFLLYNQFAVILTLAHAWAAFAILPIYVSLSKIDRALVDAAQDLGEGPIRSFLRVTLPLSMPGVIAGFLLVFIPTVGDYVTPKLVGGPNGLMIGSLIQFNFGKLENWELGAAVSVMSMLAVTGAVCLFLLGFHRLKRAMA